MKRQLLIIMMSLAFLPTLAQNFHVESFNEAVGDLSARTKSRLDANGEPCALVKVYVLDDITSVEGEVVGNVVEDGNEKLIYLCHGVKTFRIKFKYHYPLSVSFSDYGMSGAERNSVYVLEITDGKIASVSAVYAPNEATNQTKNGISTPRQDVLKFMVDNVMFKMTKVNGGTFQMGTKKGKDEAYDDESPCHLVTLSDFYIGETEVTQALWKAVMGRNPSKFSGDNRPVEQVSRNDCQVFISKLNEKTGAMFSLPTEAEWEYAARGGNKSQSYKYSGSNSIDAVAWYDDNSVKCSHAVGTKQTNELGLYDMSGNVWEWCLDRYSGYDPSEQNNPAGPSTGNYRVYRGGSWNIYPRLCRVTTRSYEQPEGKSDYIGLRLVLRK